MLDYIKRVFKSKIAQNGAWMLALQIFNTVVPLITIPYITRILTSSAYGSFSIALNWVGYLQVVVEYGFGLTGAKKVAMRKSDEDLWKTRSNIIFARLFLMIASMIIFVVIVLLAQMNTSQIICGAILFIMVAAVVFQQTWFFQGIAEMKNITLINAFSRIISVILIFCLVKKPTDLYLYCGLYVSNYIIASIVGCCVVKQKYRIGLKWTGFKEIINEIKDGWALFVSSAMTKIFGSIGVTFLGIYTTESIVGIYSAIHKIPYVMAILFSAIGQALYPFSCKAFEKDFRSGIQTIKKFFIPMVGFFSFGALLIIALNKWIVILLYGAEYAERSMLLIPFAIWTIMGIVNNFLGIQTLVASGHQATYSKIFTVNVVIMIALIAILGYFYKDYGVANASMISEMSLSIMLFIAIIKIDNNEKCL